LRIELDFFFYVIEINYDYNLFFALNVLLHIKILKREFKKGFDISYKKLQENIDYLIKFESELEEQIKWYFNNEKDLFFCKNFKIN